MLGDVAVVAFSCRPASGSEWGVGWNYVRMLSGIFDRVTLYVRNAENQIPSINAELQRLQIANVQVLAIDDTFFYPWFQRPAVHAKFLTAYYFLWLWKAFFRLLVDRTWQQHRFFFHATWVSDWIFSPLFLLPFKHRVLGPMSSQPANFNTQSRDRLASMLRVITKTMLRCLSPNVVNALLADGVIGVSRRSLGVFPWRLCMNRRVITPVHSELSWSGPRLAQKQLVYVGKHLPFKNLDLFLAVAAELLRRDDGLQVCLLGDELRQAGASDYLRESELDKHIKVRSEGLVGHEQVAAQLGGMRSVLFQSSSEVGGTVGVEAISLGAPVVCVRGHGLDTLFDLDSYPLAEPYRYHKQFVTDAADMVIEVFADYDAHSNMAHSLSRRFSIEASESQLKQMIYEIRFASDRR
jgi:glycosyltransferase involved in cell wall biosynthesis